jgi:hypothetical protein
MARGTITADPTQLARFLDITPRWVRKLKSDGVFTLARDADGEELSGRYELLSNNIAYIRYLRRKAQIDDPNESQYRSLRNQRMAAEAERTELELKLFKSQLHRSDDINFVVNNMVAAAKTRLLAIPSRVAQLVIGLTEFQKMYDTIYNEIVSALRELSGYNRKMFAKQNRAYLNAQGSNGARRHRE